MVSLSESKLTIGSLPIVASGPEKEGKSLLFSICHEVIKETWTPEIELLYKLRSFLNDNQWTEFLACFNYQLPRVTWYSYVNLGELPEVTEMAPILFGAPSFHFICFNLAEDMNKPVQVALQHNQCNSTQYTLWKTVKQFLYQLVQTMTTIRWPWTQAMLQMPTRCQTAAIVGVYSGECQQKLARADAFMKKAVQECGTTKAVRYRHHQENKMIIPLNLEQPNMSMDVEEVVRYIVTKVEANSLELDKNAYNFILLLSVKSGVLRFSECKYVARLCGVRDNNDNLTSLLKSVHDRLGHILYFHEVPKMKNLIICGYHGIVVPMESFATAALSGTPRYPQDLLAVRSTGEISMSLVNDLVCHENPTSDELTVSCLLELLKYYKLISETEGANGTTVYFMPSLLQPYPSLSQYDNEQSTTSLLFCFKHDRSPYGLFTALVAQLARTWKLAHGTRYKNFVVFITNNSTLTKVEIKNRDGYFQLTVIGIEFEPLEYSHIRREVQRALHLIKIRYAHLSSEVCHVGFYCPRGLRNNSLHCAIVRVVDGTGYLQCNAQYCQRARLHFEEKMKIWFSEEQVSIVGACTSTHKISI